MRDLYKRLGVKPTASVHEIESAVHKCRNAELKRDASAVLLVESRRQSYDRLHSTLSDIGHLRERLGLDHAANWQGHAANDFTVESGKPHSLYDELIRKVRKATRRSWPRRFLDSDIDFIAWLVRLALGFAAVLGALWFIGVLIDSQDPPGPSRLSEVERIEDGPSITQRPSTERIKPPHNDIALSPDPDVERVQTLLADRGYDVGHIDGVYGPVTEQAILL